MSSIRKYVMTPFIQARHDSDAITHDTGEEQVIPTLKNLPANSDQNVYSEKLSKPTNEIVRKGNAIKERARSRLENILKIITKVAQVNGYDNERRIRSQNGKYIANTDIVDLVMYAMQAGRVLKGEDEFILLLREADVDPAWIFNENVKSKLFGANKKASISFTPEPHIVPQETSSDDLFIKKVSPPIRQAQKRKNIEENNYENIKDQSSNKRKKMWTYSDDDDN